MSAGQQIWQVLSNQLDCSFTVKQLSLKSQVSDQRCRQILNQFKTKGWVTKEITDELLTYKAISGVKAIFRRAGRPTGQGVRKRRKKPARQRIWNSLKMLSKCSMDQLMMTSNAPLNSISKYMQALEKAGYVMCMNRQKKKDGKHKVVGKYRVYILINNTGRLYPIVKKEGCWDQNEERFYHFCEPGYRQIKENSHDQVA